MLKEAFTQKLQFSHYLLILKMMESQVMVHSQQNISGASLQNSSAEFSSRTYFELWKTIKWFHTVSEIPQIPKWSVKNWWKNIIYTPETQLCASRQGVC